MKTCSCQGENPHCYKCGGRGYLSAKGTDSGAMIDWSLLPLPMRRRIANISKPSKKRPVVSCPVCGALVTKLSKHLLKVHKIERSALPPVAKFKYCPDCGVSVDESGFDSHVAREHQSSQKPISRRQLPLVSPPPSLKVGTSVQTSQADNERGKSPRLFPVKNLISCPYCRVSLKKSRLASHMARVHPGTQKLVRPEQRPHATGHLSQKARKHVRVSQVKEDKVKSTRPAPVESVIQCSYCKAILKRSLLASHIAGSHPGTIKLIRRKQLPSESDSLSAKATKPPRTSKPARVKMKSARPSSTEINKPSWKQQFSEETLDFSRPFAHAFREHGKFGSYPSHDDFGDESKP